MAIPVLIIGESGSGKSASLRNCDPKTFGIINVSGKPLPFKNSFKTLDTDDYQKILGTLKLCKARSIVIDDSQYLMVNAFMRRFGEKGYDKYAEMAQNHWLLVQTVIGQLPRDKIVYMMSHIERDKQGMEKAKTIGNMIDQYVTMEGLFTIVLKAQCTDGSYYFRTHNSGFDTVKSPIGMFEDDTIPNDLNEVDKTIRAYYGIDKKEDKTNEAT